MTTENKKHISLPAHLADEFRALKFAFEKEGKYPFRLSNPQFMSVLLNDFMTFHMIVPEDMMKIYEELGARDKIEADPNTKWFSDPLKS